MFGKVDIALTWDIAAPRMVRTCVFPQVISSSPAQTMFGKVDIALNLGKAEEQVAGQVGHQPAVIPDHDEYFFFIFGSVKSVVLPLRFFHCA